MVLLTTPDPKGAEDSAPEGSDVWQHSFWAIIGKAATSLTSLLMTSGIARLLSPEDFGSFSLFRSLNMVLGLLCTFGLGTAALRALSNLEGRNASYSRPKIIRETIILNALVSAVFGAIAFAFCYWFSDQTLHLQMSWSMAIVTTLSGIGFGFIQTISDLLRGCGDLKGSNLIGGQRGIPIAMLIGVVFSFAAAQAGYSSWQLSAYAYAAGVITAAVVAGFLLARVSKTCHKVQIIRDERGDSVEVSDSLLSVAWPLAVVSLLTFLSSQGDQFLTGLLSVPSDVAPYLASRRVIMLLVLPLGVVNMAVRGLIAPLYGRGDKASLQRILQGGTVLASLPSLFVGTMCLIAPQFMLLVILGPGYEGAARFLQILIPGEIIMVVTGSCSLLLALTGFHRIVMWVNITMAILLMTLGPTVANCYSGEGLAMLTSLLIGAQNLAMWYLALKLTGINTFCRPGIRHLAEVITVFRRRKNFARSPRATSNPSESISNSEE